MAPGENSDPLLREIHRKNENVNIAAHCHENSIYVAKEMQPNDDPDYILIKECFEDTLLGDNKVKTYKIYRVTKSGENSEQKSDNLLLFHGTKYVNAVGILEKGFIPSNEGSYGPGVYLTASPSCAMAFALRKLMQTYSSNPYKDLCFVFVNEILESGTLKEIDRNNFLERTNDLDEIKFEKYTDKNTGENESVETHRNDRNGRKIRNSRETPADKLDHYVCHQSRAIPRYLIQCFPPL